MGNSSKWQELKTGMEKVGVKTNMFTLSCASALNAFDAAVNDYDKARTKRERSDPLIIKLAGKVREVSDTLALILSKYNETLTYLAEHATDPRQKRAVEVAASWTLGLIETIRVTRLKLPG